MLISWLGWSVSGIADCFVIFPEKDPVMEGMSSLFLSLGTHLGELRALWSPRPTLSRELLEPLRDGICVVSEAGEIEG
jgi:hypothetical protein